MGNASMKHHFATAEKTGVLNISKSKLTEFPTELKKLNSVLRTLDISENKFVELPSDIGSFQCLKSLIVNRNRLINLPDELGMLMKMETLSAVGNRLVALPPTLCQLKNLKNVYLNENSLTEFPLIFCGLKHLDVIDLSHNEIAEIPNGVGDLNVAELIINQNQIAIISEEIADCRRLKTLRLEENCLQISAIPPTILTDSQISVLSLEGNLFEMKSFMHMQGYETYMDRYTAIKKKMF